MMCYLLRLDLQTLCLLISAMRSPGEGAFGF